MMQNIQGSTDTGAEILTNVVGEFRDTIAAAGTPLSSGTDELPDLVRLHAINRCRWLWLCEFPALKSLQTEARKTLNDAAEKMLAQISSRDVKAPAGDGSEANQVAGPSFGERTRNFTQESQDGL